MPGWEGPSQQSPAHQCRCCFPCREECGDCRLDICFPGPAQAHLLSPARRVGGVGPRPCPGWPGAMAAAVGAAALGAATDGLRWRSTWAARRWLSTASGVRQGLGACCLAAQLPGPEDQAPSPPLLLVKRPLHSRQALEGSESDIRNVPGSCDPQGTGPRTEAVQPIKSREQRWWRSLTSPFQRLLPESPTCWQELLGSSQLSRQCGPPSCFPTPYPFWGGGSPLH